MAETGLLPEGTPHRCEVCGKQSRVHPSSPTGDSVCPFCGVLIWPGFGQSQPTLAHRTDAGSLYVFERSGRQFLMLVTDALGDAAVTARLRREAEQLSKVRHLNLQHVIAVTERDDRLVTVISGNDGTRLSEWLDRVATLSVGDALAIILQCSDGLAALHRHGVVYRGLSPRSIWVASNGVLRLQPQSVLDCSATALMSVKNSEYMYMAPEQIKAGAAISSRIDVYALGSLLYELLARRSPFDGDHPMEMLMNALTEPPISLSVIMPSVPQAMNEIVLAALAKDPSDRPDVETFAHQLRSLNLANERLEFMA